MYQPAYKCRKHGCENRVRGEGVCSDKCNDALDGIYAAARWFVDGDWLYILIPNRVSESEAVALMQEYAA